MRIFVTGATGVVGRRAVPLLTAVGHHVTAAGRSPEKLAGMQGHGVSTARVDLFEPTDVKRAVAGHDAILNLATHIPASSIRMFLPGAWRQNDRIRRDGSRILVDAAITEGVERVVQESFALAYAARGDEWIDETWPVAPVRYNRTVLDAEASAARFTGVGRIGVVLRFSGFYGPDAFQVIDLVRLVRKGWAPLPGSPRAFQSSISHDDAATAVVAALGVPAGVYNVTDDDPVRRREFVDALAAVLGVPAPKLPPNWFTGLTGSLGEMLSRSLRISNRKFTETSGWTPKYPSVREGWAATAAAMRRGERR